MEDGSNQMKVLFNTHKTYVQNTNLNKKQNQALPAYRQMSELSTSHYKDYQISFGARQTIAEFDPEKMPETMKQFLYENIEERKNMRPLDLQKEAFQYLNICDTVDDVKEMFPKEFQELKPFSANRAKRGYLYDLRATNTERLSVFADAKNTNIDLPVYLLRKIYTEGKTLKQINSDFHTDVRPDFRLAKPDYFTYADFKSMGVKIPELSYWQSLLATKDDKTSRNYYGKILKKRVVSEETKEKIRQGQFKKFEKLTPDQKSDLALKIVTGRKKSESTFVRFQDHIMRIAAYEAGIGEDMIKHFESLKTDEEFKNMKFASWNDKRSEMFTSFWHKNPEDAAKLSEAILNNITNFKVAQACGDESIEMRTLLDLSKELKAMSRERVRMKARERYEAQKAQSQTSKPAADNPAPLTAKQKSRAEYKAKRGQHIKKTDEFKQLRLDFEMYLKKAVSIMPEGFKRLYIPFMTNHPDMTPAMMNTVLTFNERSDAYMDRLGNDERVKIAFSGFADDSEKLVRELYKIDEGFAAFIQESKEHEDASKVVNNIFDAEHFSMKNSAEQAVNEVLYDITKNPQVMGYNRAEAVQFVENEGLRNQVQAQKDKINSLFVDYQRGISKPLMEQVFENQIWTMMDKASSFDDYAAAKAFGKYADGVKAFIPEIISNPEEKALFKKYVEETGGKLKFFFKADKPFDQRLVASASIIFDYLTDRILPRIKQLKK